MCFITVQSYQVHGSKITFNTTSLNWFITQSYSNDVHHGIYRPLATPHPNTHIRYGSVRHHPWWVQSQRLYCNHVMCLAVPSPAVWLPWMRSTVALVGARPGHHGNKHRSNWVWWQSRTDAAGSLIWHTDTHTHNFCLFVFHSLLLKRYMHSHTLKNRPHINQIKHR